MPVPNPRKGESQSDYVGRCMADTTMQEYDQKQRAAICYSKWREHHGGGAQASAGDVSASQPVRLATSLYGAGVTHARGLINSGHVDENAPWSFSAEDGDALLGPNGDNWTRFASWHLAEHTDATADTKGRWGYPFGKGGRVYASALRAIASRASAAGADAVSRAASSLLKDITGDSPNNVTRFAARAGRATASAYRIVRNEATEQGEIWLYGMIGGGGFFDLGGITAKQFQKDLKALGSVKAIELHINSEGGDAFDASTIYTLLTQHPAPVHVSIDGLAASAATYIAMAGDTVKIAEGGFFMIHRASAMAHGNVDELIKTADLLRAVDGSLADVYASRTRISVDRVREMMAAETWLTGKQAVEQGFADEIMPNAGPRACLAHPEHFRHPPAALLPERVALDAQLAELGVAV